MEVRQDEMTQDKHDEMKVIARNNVCAECGADLQIHTDPEAQTLVVGCLNRDHHGLVERMTYSQAMRRGDIVHPVIENAIGRKMIPKDDLGRAMNLLALRYPDAIKDPPTAALFLMDCARLDIDPLISPAEAVPIPFRSRKKTNGGVTEKVTVQMIITQDGFLSMAARGCKEDWVGPPRTMRLEEYLASLPENQGRSLEEVASIAREIKESDCSDPDAWYYVAIGKRRDGEDIPVPGWFTHADHDRAKSAHLPAATQPGNQARVRAIKHWVRKVYPEARQRMLELTAEWYQRAEGIKEAQQYIDAEYSFISKPVGEEKIGATAGTDIHRAEQGGETRATSLSSPKGEEAHKNRGAPAAPPTMPIDLTWLTESMDEINWSEITAKTWLATYCQVDITGPLREVISRLTHEQATRFSNEIQTRVANKQAQLF